MAQTIKNSNKKSNIILGHSRLVTNSMVDNQPLYKHNFLAIHNGIITNFENIYKKFKFTREFQIDTEIILDLINYYLSKNFDIKEVVEFVLSEIEGSASCVICLPEKGKVILFSNNGSLYFGEKDNSIYISSESYSLRKIRCNNIKQVEDVETFNIPKSEKNLG